MSPSPRHAFRPTRGDLIDVLGIIVLVAILAPFVVYTAPPVIGASESYVVKSGSMEPTIQTGAVIFVYEVDPSTIEEGDIIAYDLRDPDRHVTTHRVVDVIRDGDLRFRTKGDANEEPDRYQVPADAVVGRVPIVAESVMIPVAGHVDEYPLQIPYLGRILVFAGSKWGIFFFVMVPAALLIASELFVLARAYYGFGAASRSSDGALNTRDGDK